MSEFQYVGFRAIDGPVSEENLEYMRRQSSRAEITPWAFDNEYHFGDFRGNAEEMLRRGYDIHLHYANFGIRKLLIRLPLGVLNTSAIKPFLGSGALRFSKDKQGTGRILAIEPIHEPGDLDQLFDIDTVLDRLVPLRAEILEGDLRPLYLAHLAVACDGEHHPEETTEAPVPAGLKTLSDAQRSLAGLYGLGNELIAAAARESVLMPVRDDPKARYAQWLRGQQEARKNAWLAAWMADPTSQEEDGTWELRNQMGSGLPPTSESRETMVLLGLLAWEPQILANPEQAATARASREKTVAWLRDNKSTDTLQAIALRLLLDVRSGKPSEQLQPGIDRLLSMQNTDGGWRQLPKMPSDAYATGQTLWVLSFAGVPPNRPEIARAVSFLVASQRADGSWPMPYRSHPGLEPTRERSPVPITYFGTAWATLGLARMVPPVLDPAVRHKRALDMIVAINGRVERDEGDPDKPVTSAYIGFGPFDDDNLAQAAVHLTVFPKLKSLSMKFSKLTDAGLLQLQPLSQLEDLSLETSAITDAGLVQLQGFTQLKTLNLKGTKVTDAGVQALQQALPNVKVER